MHPCERNTTTLSPSLAVRRLGLPLSCRFSTAGYVNGGIPLERNLKAGTLTSLRL